MSYRKPRKHGYYAENARHSIRILRESKNLTLREVASRIAEAGHPLSKDALSQIETGFRNASLEDAIFIAHVLDVSIETLIDPELRKIQLVEIEERAQAEMDRLRRLAPLGLGVAA